MKLLLDENLSPRLVALLSDVYPDSQHVEDVGLGETDDAQVWAYAETHGFAIVSTAVIEMVLHNSVDAIQRFGDGEAACLMLGRR